MRNPDRIPVILEAIRTVWERNPDLRLMQLLLNHAREHEHFEDGGDMYHVEDGELVDRLLRAR